MIAIFVSYNQAFNDEIVELLEQFGQRGFTRWDEVMGRGCESGEPHYGNHAWPSMNQAVLTMVDDSIADGVLEEKKKKNWHGSNFLKRRIYHEGILEHDSVDVHGRRRMARLVSRRV